PNKQRRWFAVLLGQGSEFAFVVFGAAQMANVLEPEWAKSLTLAVALSMAATPILLVILNRLEQSSTEEAREADEIDEEQPRQIPQRQTHCPALTTPQTNDAVYL
ncbi:hypothetical protein ACUODF_49025, partial [Escherichia coli]